MTKEIKIVKIEEKKSRTGSKFTVYKTIDKKKGKLLDVKFRQDCNIIPDQRGILTVDTSEMNLDLNREYPCLWIKSVISFKTLAEDNSRNDAILDEYF